MLKRNLGWIIFIVECADGTYFGGMTKSYRRRLREINSNKINYFINRPYRLPVRLVYKETELPFREAVAKAEYMKEMNRKLKRKLIDTGVWPMGGPWKEYLRELAEEGRI